MARFVEGKRGEGGGIWRGWIIRGMRFGERVDHHGKQISGFRCCVAEFSSLLRCDALSLDEWLPTFRSNLVLSSSEPNSLVP